MSKKRVRAKLGFRNASVDQQIDTVTRLVSSIQALPPAKRDRLDLEDLQGALAEAVLVRQLLEKYRSKARELLARQVEEVMPRLRFAARCTKSCAEVLAGAGDDAAVLETGLELTKSTRIRRGIPPVPTDLRARVRAGAITLLWKCSMRRSLFNIEYTTDLAAGDWRKLFAVKTRVTFEDAVPGTLYWFRIRAWNANGESDWSSLLSVRAV